MTEPRSTPPSTGEGTDVRVDPAHLDDVRETPASSDPEQMTEDAGLGGTAGGNAGGAG